MERPCDTVSMRRNLDGEWPEQYQKVILPYSLLDKTRLFGPSGSRKRRTGQGLYRPRPSATFLILLL